MAKDFLVNGNPQNVPKRKAAQICSMPPVKKR